MAGSAISHALERAGYQQQLTPSRAALDLLDPQAVQQWFSEHQPAVVQRAPARGGGARRGEGGRHPRQQHFSSGLHA